MFYILHNTEYIVQHFQWVQLKVRDTAWAERGTDQQGVLVD